MPGRFWVGAGHKVEVGCGVRAGGVDLLAVDHPLVAVFHRAALQRGKVRAAARLGEAEGQRELAADELGDVVVFLLVRAGRQDRRRAAASAANADANAGELLLHDVLAHAVAVLAAVLLRPAYAEPAPLADLAEQVGHQRAAPAPSARVTSALPAVHLVDHLGRHVLGNELPDLRAQCFLLGCVTKVHLCPPQLESRRAQAASQPCPRPRRLHFASVGGPCQGWGDKVGRASSHRLKDVRLSREGQPARRPSTLRSSSRSGQWMPWPVPIIRQLSRSSGVA